MLNIFEVFIVIIIIDNILFYRLGIFGIVILFILLIYKFLILGENI